MNFVLIGGCNFSNRENRNIHKAIIKLSKKAKPRLLYIHVSSKKIDDIIKTFNEFDVDLKIYENLNDIDSADIIFIGGGNTEEVIERFKKEGIIDKLLSVIDSKIICGVSAGAILWFKKFYSDTYAYIDNSYGYNFKLLDGIGYLNGYISPHYNEAGKEAFVDELGNNFGIGLENNTALFITNDSINYILDRPKSAIYFYLDKKLYVLNEDNKKIVLDNILKK